MTDAPVISDAVVEAALATFDEHGRFFFPCDFVGRNRDYMRAAITAAVLAEREECARICELAGMAEQYDYGLVRGTQNYFRAARAIRARSTGGKDD